MTTDNTPASLSGRVALVTGAGSATGMGNAIARELSDAGAAVVLADIDHAGAQRNAQAIGGGARATRLDVCDEDSVKAVITEIGRIDILVNNAGITEQRPIWELTTAEFDRMLSVNLRGGFLCLSQVVGGMMERRWGRIIWLSSVAARIGGGIVGTAHYAASKAGVIGLCQAAARELGPYGVTSNAIAPGFIATGITAKAIGVAMEQQLAESVAATVPLRRVGQPEEAARVVRFLVSDAASYVTGEVINVNGGMNFS